MSEYDNRTPIPDPFGVLDLAKVALDADDVFLGAIGGSGRVYLHEFPQDLPDGIWSRAVIRLPIRDGVPASEVSATVVDFVVQAETISAGVFDIPRARVWNIVSQAARVLKGLEPSGSLEPIHQRTTPSNPQIDPTTDPPRYFSNVIFRVTLN